ncbi:serine/arginine repetitive matrix protein 2 [Nocardioidaceae bacterium Broad-1]|nr:serine/arginine repetitive matrix protein 2 [Nocardioidaceae bacterium Broad-1]
MPTTQPHKRDAAEREAKLDALHARMTEAVEGLVTGRDWRKAMEFAARFRARSFRNVSLIAVQHTEAYALGLVPNPMPTYVAGFRQWQSLGRTVMKGQHGYQIFAPVTGRFASFTPSDPGSWRRLTRGERPGAGETVRTKVIGLRIAHVFDVSQTEGDPLPEPPKPRILKGAAPEGLWDGLANQVAEHGYKLHLVSDATAIAGRNGQTDFAAHEVAVRTDMDDAAKVKTLAHELGHVMLHGPNRFKDPIDAELHRGLGEVEAESVAMMVAAAHGLDTSAYTVPYVATWANLVPGSEPGQVIQQTADRVRRAAVEILDRLDTAQLSNGDPPGLQRTQAPSTTPAEAARAVTWTQPSEAIGL